VLETRLDDLAQLGFDLELFGLSAIRVRALPAAIAPSELRAAISELLDLAETDARAWQEEALITLVCHSAVRAGQTLSFSEMRDLVQQLEMTSTPHSCPHGRPTMIHLSAAQLEREFGRR
jgi:DNA mismatch repair protein MutL